MTDFINIIKPFLLLTIPFIENLIESIENGTNTSHNLDESVNAVEQVNSLGQRVIPGNVDLAQLFSGAVANRMNEIQNSINSNIPIFKILFRFGI